MTRNQCRNIIHVATSISCRDINLSLCSFELVSSYVATSILCRDITLCLCRFQLFVPDVAISIPCRDISSSLCSFQLMVPDVATSISCHDINLRNCNLQLSTSYVATLISYRDINLCLWSFNWLLLVSRHQSLVATLYLIKGKPVIASRRFSCRELHPLSRHQPLSRHHDAVATSFIKSLVNPQLPNL